MNCIDYKQERFIIFFKKAAQVAATSVFLLFFNSTVVLAETTDSTESIKNQTLTANRKIYAKVDGDEDFQLVHQDRANLTYDEKVSFENLSLIHI